MLDQDWPLSVGAEPRLPEVESLCPFATASKRGDVKVKKTGFNTTSVPFWKVLIKHVPSADGICNSSVFIQLCRLFNIISSWSFYQRIYKR